MQVKARTGRSKGGCKNGTRRRLWRAWACVAATIAAIVGMCAIAEAAEDAGHGSGAHTEAVWDGLRQGGTEEEALAAAGFAISREAPAWMSAEVLDESWTVRYADEQWSIVRVDIPLGTEECAARIANALQSKGWTSVESGYEGVDTFVKAEGSFSLLMVEWAQHADGVSAVMHIRHA